MAQVATPVRRMIDATNRGDTEAFIASFTDDAYLVDWGREFHGHEGVARWNETDNIGKHDHQLRVLPATILPSAGRPHPCVRHRRERPPRPRP
jgi:ketosteroid isomerase-like protein